jgi:DnaJ-class molecular chaperone
LPGNFGGETTVTTLDSEQNSKSARPAGTQFVCPARDCLSSFRKDDRGDLYIRLVILLPEHLSGRQRSLLEEFSGS